MKDFCETSRHAAKQSGDCWEGAALSIFGKAGGGNITLLYGTPLLDRVGNQGIEFRNCTKGSGAGKAATFIIKFPL